MMVGVDLIDRKFRNIMAMVNKNNDYTKVMSAPNPARESESRFIFSIQPRISY